MNMSRLGAACAVHRESIMKTVRLLPLRLRRGTAVGVLAAALPALTACVHAQTADPAYAPGYDPAYDSGAVQKGVDPAAANVAPMTATQEAPPPLPVYQQPAVPGDGYMWVPGYWARNVYGFYWVPGAWVIAPYTGALWTPGYWAFDGGWYRWHPGYWGPHVGFYGGINYGFGYLGFGYVGGYWNNSRFYYNRSITTVNVTRVKYVYERRVDVRDYDRNRISYHGGPRGIQRGPSPQELAARNEQHRPPTRAQHDHAIWAGNDRGQRFGHGNAPGRMVDDRAIGGPRDGKRWDDPRPGNDRNDRNDRGPGRPDDGQRPGNNRPGQDWTNNPSQQWTNNAANPSGNRPQNGRPDGGQNGNRPNPGRPDAGQAQPGRPDQTAPRPNPGRPDNGQLQPTRPDQAAPRPNPGRPDGGQLQQGRPPQGNSVGTGGNGRPDAGRPQQNRPDTARPEGNRPGNGFGGQQPRPQPQAAPAPRPQAERTQPRESRPAPQQQSRPAQQESRPAPQREARQAPAGGGERHGGGNGGNGGGRGGDRGDRGN